jgi:VCBS repeat-containing protein
MLSVTSGAIAADPGSASNLTWNFNSSPETFNYLNVGQHVTLDYTVQATDSQGASTTHTVEVTINGTDDAPVANADTGAVNGGATLSVTAANGVILGAGADTDVDNASNTLVVSGAVAGAGPVTQGSGVGTSLAGTYGHLTLNSNGSYTYVADNAGSLAAGVHGTDTFTYTDKDPGGLVSNTTTLSIDVTGVTTNHAPTNLTFAPVAQNGNGLTLGTFHATDADNDVLTYTSSDPTNFTINGSTGAITAIASPLNEQVTITATDTHNASVSQTYNVLIGDNQDNSLVVSSAGNNPTITDGLSGGDTITGTSGNDYMWGGSGNDTFIPGLGNDYMSGGGGNNTFQFDTALDGVNNLDRIADFDTSKDTLSLAHAIFSAVVGYNVGTGALNASELANVTNNGVGASTAHLVYDQTSHTLYYDADGANTTSGRTAFVVLDGVVSLSAASFHIF